MITRRRQEKNKILTIKCSHRGGLFLSFCSFTPGVNTSRWKLWLSNAVVPLSWPVELCCHLVPSLRNVVGWPENMSTLFRSQPHLFPLFFSSDRKAIFFNSHNVSKPESSSDLTTVRSTRHLPDASCHTQPFVANIHKYDVVYTERECRGGVSASQWWCHPRAIPVFAAGAGRVPVRHRCHHQQPNRPTCCHRRQRIPW